MRAYTHMRPLLFLELDTETKNEPRYHEKVLRDYLHFLHTVAALRRSDPRLIRSNDAGQSESAVSYSRAAPKFFGRASPNFFYNRESVGVG